MLMWTIYCYMKNSRHVLRVRSYFCEKYLHIHAFIIVENFGKDLVFLGEVGTRSTWVQEGIEIFPFLNLHH